VCACLCMCVCMSVYSQDIVRVRSCVRSVDGHLTTHFCLGKALDAALPQCKYPMLPLPGADAYVCVYDVASLQQSVPRCVPEKKWGSCPPPCTQHTPRPRTHFASDSRGFSSLAMGVPDMNHLERADAIATTVIWAGRRAVEASGQRWRQLGQVAKPTRLSTQKRLRCVFWAGKSSQQRHCKRYARTQQHASTHLDPRGSVRMAMYTHTHTHTHTLSLSLSLTKTYTHV
jgi:hypothetical protein